MCQSDLRQAAEHTPAPTAHPSVPTDKGQHRTAELCCQCWAYKKFCLHSGAPDRFSPSINPQIRSANVLTPRLHCPRVYRILLMPVVPPLMGVASAGGHSRSSEAHRCNTAQVYCVAGVCRQAPAGGTGARFRQSGVAQHECSIVAGVCGQAQGAGQRRGAASGHQRRQDREGGISKACSLPSQEAAGCTGWQHIHRRGVCGAR